MHCIAYTGKYRLVRTVSIRGSSPRSSCKGTDTSAAVVGKGLEKVEGFDVETGVSCG